VRTTMVPFRWAFTNATDFCEALQPRQIDSRHRTHQTTTTRLLALIAQPGLNVIDVPLNSKHHTETATDKPADADIITDFSSVCSIPQMRMKEREETPSKQMPSRLGHQFA
jgi:hypothetical protein